MDQSNDPSSHSTNASLPLSASMQALANAPPLRRDRSHPFRRRRSPPGTIQYHSSHPTSERADRDQEDKHGDGLDRLATRMIQTVSEVMGFIVGMEQRLDRLENEIAKTNARVPR